MNKQRCCENKVGARLLLAFFALIANAEVLDISL